MKKVIFLSILLSSFIANASMLVCPKAEFVRQDLNLDNKKYINGPYGLLYKPENNDHIPCSESCNKGLKFVSAHYSDEKKQICCLYEYKDLNGIKPLICASLSIKPFFSKNWFDVSDGQKCEGNYADQCSLEERSR